MRNLSKTEVLLVGWRRELEDWARIIYAPLIYNGGVALKGLLCERDYQYKKV